MARAGYNRALLMWFGNFLLPAISVITSYSYKTQTKIWIETLTIPTLYNCTKPLISQYVSMIGKFWYDLFLALITHMKLLSNNFLLNIRYTDNKYDSRTFLAYVVWILGSAMRLSFFRVFIKYLKEFSILHYNIYDRVFEQSYVILSRACLASRAVTLLHLVWANMIFFEHFMMAYFLKHKNLPKKR